MRACAFEMTEMRIIPLAICVCRAKACLLAHLQGPTRVSLNIAFLCKSASCGCDAKLCSVPRRYCLGVEMLAGTLSKATIEFVDKIATQRLEHVMLSQNWLCFPVSQRLFQQPVMKGSHGFRW